MRPIKRGSALRLFSTHKDAKPHLIKKIGLYCSYCESHLRAQDLHVEHIYPQNAHPSLKEKWCNFLLACNTCNSYKNQYQGKKQQQNLLKSQIWPHIDNSAKAFIYKENGEIQINNNLSISQRDMAEKTIEMVGLIKSPAVTKIYSELSITYDGTDNRSEIWDIAMGELDDFIQYNKCPIKLANAASKMGFFSIWMSVFDGHPIVKEQLIIKFKADSRCFDRIFNFKSKGKL